MTLEEIKDYFESYAEKHIELMHVPGIEEKRTFFCLNTEDESVEFLRNISMDLVMVLMPYDKSQTPPVAGNYNWNKTGAFLIMKRCDPTDKNQIIAAQSQCEAIADDFCTVMIEDRHTKLTSIESGSISMSPVGPVVDSHFGYMCMFNIVDSFNHWVNPDRWLP